MENMLKETLQLLVNFHESEANEARILEDIEKQRWNEAKVLSFKKVLKMMEDPKELKRMLSLLS